MTMLEMLESMGLTWRSHLIITHLATTRELLAVNGFMMVRDFANAKNLSALLVRKYRPVYNLLALAQAMEQVGRAATTRVVDLTPEQVGWVREWQNRRCLAEMESDQ